ncbi:MAG: hypothetical protein K2N90_05240 [Lachnospiraceae bacterium]|nr:hypothetical protein [Lachnospiraceae bacterium]
MSQKYKMLLVIAIAVAIVLAIYIKCHNNNVTKHEYECQNTYFYTATEKRVEYEGYFYTYSYRDIWQNINLHITNLQTFENGALYTLELEQLESADPLDKIALGRRYLGYFYVTDNAIYYTSATMEGYTDGENKRILRQIQTDEAAFLEECDIVCCENGTVDVTDENGYHAFVETDGDRRIFRFYNDYFYGSKDYKLIVWEKGKGIVYYIHGNGAKNMHIEFGADIDKEQQTDYGYPYKLFHESADDF